MSDSFQSNGSSCAGRSFPCLCFPLGGRERKVQLLLLRDLEQLSSIDTVKTRRSVKRDALEIKAWCLKLNKTGHKNRSCLCLTKKTGDFEKFKKVLQSLFLALSQYWH